MGINISDLNYWCRVIETVSGTGEILFVILNLRIDFQDCLPKLESMTQKEDTVITNPMKYITYHKSKLG